MPSAASARNKLILLWSLLASTVELVACTPAPRIYTCHFLAMGTRFDLSLQTDTPEHAAQLAAAIEHDMLHWEREWYPWGSQPGELKALNQALSEGRSFDASLELTELLSRAQRLQQQSDGYFDPAVAPLVRAWGFDDVNKDASRPSDVQLDTWARDHATLADLAISNAKLSSARRDLQIDLGAIAKGRALELAMQHLKAAGIRNAMLNAGGQIKVIGDVPGKAVEIRDPRHNQALAQFTLRNDESVSTSGDYERYAMLNGKRVHHLLDPHTGMPVDHTQAVTVVSMDAALADAASTALMAAGPNNWRRIARQLGVDQVLRIDGSGAIEASTALYARLQWNTAAISGHRVAQIYLND